VLLLLTVLFSLILPANNHNHSVELQPYTEVQPQVAIGSVTAGPIAPHANAQFSWVNTLLGAGVFLGLGASAAITLKVDLVQRCMVL
jgi:peroxin-14